MDYKGEKWNCKFFLHGLLFTKKPENIYFCGIENTEAFHIIE